MTYTHPAIAQQSTTELLRHLQAHVPEHMTLGTLIASLGDRSFGLAILVLALPNMLPFIPGFASVCAVPMLIISGQMVWGCPCISLPKRFEAITLSGATVSKMLARCIPALSRVERLVRPRLPLFTSRLAEKTIGLCWAILACIIFLPIPFGDPPPSICASLLALGLLEKDGALIVLGFGASAVTVYGMYYLILNVTTYAWHLALSVL